MARPGSAVLLLLGTAAAIFGHPDRRPPRPDRSRPLAGALPRPDHTVVVVMENHSYFEIIGNPDAPYINSLRALGASFTDSHAVSHPSEPNYLALFAGTTEGLSDDSCPHTYSDPNLASGLLAEGTTFAGYSESMPSNGYTGCGSGDYARKHNPWVNFTNVPPSANLTFDEFPADAGLLPTVAIVVPNLCDDMHDCGVATGDAWLSNHLGGYVSWAKTHNSLFVLTFDEGTDAANRIATIFVGPMVVPGDSAVRIDHYSVLRTLEDLYGVPPTGNAAFAGSAESAFAAPTPTPTPTATPTPPARMSVDRGPAPSRRPIVVPFRPTIAPTPTP